MPTDSLYVSLRTVPFVLRESILRMLRVQLSHYLVAVGFCQNGSGGDRKRDAIPFHHSLLGNLPIKSGFRGGELSIHYYADLRIGRQSFQRTAGPPASVANEERG